MIGACVQLELFCCSCIAKIGKGVLGIVQMSIKTSPQDIDRASVAVYVDHSHGKLRSACGHVVASLFKSERINPAVIAVDQPLLGKLQLWLFKSPFPCRISAFKPSDGCDAVLI